MKSPATAASTTAPPPINSRRSLGLANPFGGSSSNSSSVRRGTLVAFSNPTSISTLIVPPDLLRINFFHLAYRTRQVRARLVKSVQRRNLVVVCARQRVLRLNHFDVVCDSSFLISRSARTTSA